MEKSPPKNRCPVVHVAPVAALVVLAVPAALAVLVAPAAPVALLVASNRG